MMGVDSLLNEVEQRKKKALETLESEYGDKRENVKKRTEEQRAYIMESAKREALNEITSDLSATDLDLLGRVAGALRNTD